jgi:hypothetical protein
MIFLHFKKFFHIILLIVILYVNKIRAIYFIDYKKCLFNFLGYPSNYASVSTTCAYTVNYVQTGNQIFFLFLLHKYLLIFVAI